MMKFNLVHVRLSVENANVISNWSFIVSNYCVITEVVNPKDAKEAAKRLVESGVCSFIIICMLHMY